MKDIEILNENTRYAVIGMNADKKKYANKIYRKLKEHNKIVYGVNPNYTEIEGERIYSKIDDIEDDIDMAVMVVGPKIGITMLDAIKEKGVKILWLQPGTINDALLAKAEDLHLKTVESCVLKVYYENQN